MCATSRFGYISDGILAQPHVGESDDVLGVAKVAIGGTAPSISSRTQ